MLRTLHERGVITLVASGRGGQKTWRVVR